MINLENITKNYFVGEVKVQAIKNINLKIKKGDFLSIMGASGSGKSTLLNIVGLLDTPTEGSYSLDGKKINYFNKNDLAEIRRNKIGFVFQSFNLIEQKTAFENVILPLIYQKKEREESREKTEHFLNEMGVYNYRNHFPNQLSGGQKQRVAIARALVSNPEMILADEPTGALDSSNSFQLMDLFNKINELGKTIILITHDNKISEFANYKLTLEDGVLKSLTP